MNGPRQGNHQIRHPHFRTRNMSEELTTLQISLFIAVAFLIGAFSAFSIDYYKEKQTNPGLTLSSKLDALYTNTVWFFRNGGASSLYPDATYDSATGMMTYYEISTEHASSPTMNIVLKIGGVGLVMILSCYGVLFMISMVSKHTRQYGTVIDVGRDARLTVDMGNGKMVKMNLFGIERPDSSEGRESRRFVQSMCQDRTVEICNKTDKIGEGMTSEVLLLDGTNINLALLEKGLARRSEKQSTPPSYWTKQNTARANGEGIWSEAAA